MTQIGILGAFLGGLLSLVSPCSALLLPSFFAYAFDGVGKLISRTVAFYVGLAVTLVPMGAAAGLFGSLLNEHRSTVTLVSGLVLVVLGLVQLSGHAFGLSGAAQQLSGKIRISSTLSVFALGAVYGLSGFCAGPLLGSVLTVSAVGGNPWYGGLLLAIYALGMAFPLFLLALAWERFKLSSRSWLRGREITIGPLRLHTTNILSGLLFIGIGLLFIFTDGASNLGNVVGMDEQYSLQVWLQRASAMLSDVSVLVVLVAVVLAFVLWKLWRLNRSDNRSEGTSETEAAVAAASEDQRSDAAETERAGVDER